MWKAYLGGIRMTKINFVAHVAAAIIVLSVFLPYCSKVLARIGVGKTDTTFEMGSGIILLVFVALTILFVLLRKKTQVIVYSALLIIQMVIQIIITTFDIAYMTSFSFEHGFYISLVSVLLLVFQEQLKRLAKIWAYRFLRDITRYMTMEKKQDKVQFVATDDVKIGHMEIVFALHPALAALPK